MHTFLISYLYDGIMLLCNIQIILHGVVEYLLHIAVLIKKQGEIFSVSYGWSVSADL